MHGAANQSRRYSIYRNYQQNFPVLRDEVTGVVRDRELAWSCWERCQEIVVNKVVTTESHEDKRIVHQPLCLGFSDQCTQPLLVLLEQFKLPKDSYNAELQIPQKQTIKKMVRFTGVSAYKHNLAWTLFAAQPIDRSPWRYPDCVKSRSECRLCGKIYIKELVFLLGARVTSLWSWSLEDKYYI